MAEPGPDKYDKDLGFILGVLLVIIWIALSLFVQNALFPRQNFTENPFTAWLTLGLMPFVILAGNHLIYRRKLGGIETVRSVIGLKSNLLGFLLWFLVLGVLHLAGYAISYQVNGVGGFLRFSSCPWHGIGAQRGENLRRARSRGDSAR
ncbi:hypothetical protein [Methanoculleus sp.]|uniref:hypothetical protein n=1 Tax=Methanoculleus sp. TaxID=90427 RepID=UPI0025F1C0DE|nr:hypothetical protein [Methanoculleus sp.]